MRPPAPAPSVTVAFSRVYPGEPGQVREVRGDLRRLLDGCPIKDDVILCASELATNAILHSLSGQPGSTFAVCAELRPGSHARLEVQDNGGPETANVRIQSSVARSGDDPPESTSSVALSALPSA
jgi:serine/threonine-protein kinase RsbW